MNAISEEALRKLLGVEREHLSEGGPASSKSSGDRSANSTYPLRCLQDVTPAKLPTLEQVENDLIGDGTCRLHEIDRETPSRLLAEGIMRTYCETIAATRDIPADEVWAEFSAHLDVGELGAICASKIPEDLEQRTKTDDPEARREYVAIVTTELRDALERHGGDTSLLADAP